MLVKKDFISSRPIKSDFFHYKIYNFFALKELSKIELILLEIETGFKIF